MPARSKGVFLKSDNALLSATKQAAATGLVHLVTRSDTGLGVVYYVYVDSPWRRAQYQVMYVVSVTTGPAHPQNAG